MMDYNGRSEFEGDLPENEASNGSAGLAAQDTGSGAGAGARRILSPDASNVVILPAGASLSDIRVEGSDLVVTLEDGTTLIIPDGAINVPQLVIDGVAVPPANLAALLTGNEPEPEAGAPQSSGGNFAAAEGDIQAAYDLGNLLPYTELAFPEDRDPEIIPYNVDQDPDVAIATPNQPGGVENATASVDEAGLPARNDGEPAGSDAASNSETTNGTILFSAPDGLASITLNGTPITDVGQVFQTDLGTLTITSIADGTIGFSYTLDDNTTGAETDSFVVVVTETDGDTAEATLDIDIVDDAPIARDDTDTVAAGTHAAIFGNVVTGTGTDTGAEGADTLGADDATLTAIVNDTGSAVANEDGSFTIQGEYGELTIEPDGSYSYTRDPNTPGGVTEDFTYTLTDSDGSADTAVLTIIIEDAPVRVTSVPTEGDAGTIVDEDGLPPREGEAPGSEQDTDSETTSGTVTFSAPDGVDTVEINGVVVTGPGQVIPVDGGTLTITDFDPDNGTIDYEFTLDDNTTGDDTTVPITVTVTDIDGDSDTGEFEIVIVDDVPTAVDDSAAQDAENAPVTVDAFANDIPGADSVALDAIAAVDGSLSGTGTVVYNGDGTFTYTPGPGEQGTVTFDYTITDGDGDTSTATVTIELLDDSTPTIDLAGDNTVDEAALGARGDEPAGSNAASNDEIAAGTIPITTGNDTIGSLVINGVDVTAGGTVTTPKGELTITLVNGIYNYSYELTDNTLSDPDSDSFTLTVTDSDGDTAGTTLVIAIADDAPSAQNDENSIGAGTYGPVGGNVLTNDTQGADGAVVTSYTGVGGTGIAGETIQGEFGTLTINADGSYSYTRDPGTEGGVTDTFSYIITDDDGDTATANLVITIADSPVTLDLPVAGQEPGTVVDEAGLNPDGSEADTDSESTSGTFTFTAPDGPAIITVGGTTITTVGQTIDGAFGTLTITSIDDGVIGYTYELTTNTDGDNTQDDFAVTVTDQDDDTTGGTLTIQIIDDEPIAVDDADSLTEGGPTSTSGNVITNAEANGDNGADTPGADGATVQNAGTFQGTYGTLVLGADGSYTYTLTPFGISQLETLADGESFVEEFPYVLVDGDGDVDDATLTIRLNGENDTVTITGLNADVDVPEVSLDEDDLANPGDDQGSDGTGPTAVDGSFGVTAPDGLDTVQVNGVTVVTGGTFGGSVEVANDGVYSVTITGWTPVFAADGTTVVSATFTYSAALLDNTLAHDELGQDDIVNMLTVTATDQDLDSAADVLDVQIVDDVPLAKNDDAGQVTENAAFTIEALDNDVFGADGVDTTDVTDVFVATQPSQGTVTYDPGTGLFTYTPNSGAGSNGNLTDSFTYTIVDGDGDTSTATVDVTLQPDSVATGGTVTATVDDDGLDAGNPNSVAGDLDANDGDDPADMSEKTFTGTLAFNVGNDDPATISFAATLDGSTAMVGTETVTYSVVWRHCHRHHHRR